MVGDLTPMHSPPSPRCSVSPCPADRAGVGVHDGGDALCFSVSPGPLLSLSCCSGLDHSHMANSTSQAQHHPTEADSASPMMIGEPAPQNPLLLALGVIQGTVQEHPTRKHPEGGCAQGWSTAHPPQSRGVRSATSEAPCTSWAWEPGDGGHS